MRGAWFTPRGRLWLAIALVALAYALAAAAVGVTAGALPAVTGSPWARLP